MAEIQGSYDDLLTVVPGALAALLDAGDVGASVAVFADGEAVVDVWGGFAATGKDGVLVRHLLAHTAGLPGWNGPATAGGLCDWPAATARLAGSGGRVGGGSTDRTSRAPDGSGWRGWPPGG